MTVKRSSLAKVLGAKKEIVIQVALYVPSRDRNHQLVNQAYWLDEALRMFGKLFGRATEFVGRKGIWRDDESEGALLFDEPVMIQSYVARRALQKSSAALRDFIVRMGRETNQKAVVLLIGNESFEISF